MAAASGGKVHVMQGNRKFLMSVVAAGLAVLAASATSANAACAALAGSWYFYDMQGQSPGIQSKFTSVVVGPNLNNKQTLETFSFTNTNNGYDNMTTTVIKCLMTVKATGSFTAPCTAYMPGKTQNVNISGKLTLSACDFGGTINVQGDPTPVTIQGGHVNGNVGAGIATQGTMFHHFTLVKK